MTNRRECAKCSLKLIPNIGFTGKCPSCGERLEFETNIDGTKSRHLICPNLECAGALFGQMMNWIRVQEIRGLGQHIVRGLIDRGITSPADLYRASEEDFAEASGSEKLGKKLHRNVQATRQIELHKFLTGLNITGLGKTNGKRLAKKYETLDAVLGADKSSIASIQGVKTTAAKIHDGLNRMHDAIDDLRKVITVKDHRRTGPLAGKLFCMTGLRTYNGVDLAEFIEKHGGEVKSSVTKDLDYLIMKDKNSKSNKAEKARSYGVDRINPDDLFELINNAS